MVLFATLYWVAVNKSSYFVTPFFMMKLKEEREVVGDVISSIRSHAGRCRKNKEGEVLMQMTPFGTEFCFFYQSVGFTPSVIRHF